MISYTSAGRSPGLALCVMLLWADASPLSAQAPWVNAEILDIAQTADGVLWLATPEGLLSFDGNSEPPPDLAAAPIFQLSQNHITAIYPDADGYLWVGTQRRGLFKFDGRSMIPSSRPNRLGTGWEVTNLLQDRSGILWIGTPSDLLLLEGLATSSLPGLPGVDVHEIMEDSYGHVWVAVGSALFRRVQEIFQSISIPLGLDSSFIHDLAMGPQGGLWLARQNSLVRFGGDFEQGGLPQTYEFVKGIPEGKVRRLVSDSDGLWIGTAGSGLYRWSAGKMESVGLPRSGLEITSLLIGRFNHLWIGSKSGLFRHDLPSDGNARQSLPSARISAVVENRELKPLPLGSAATWNLSPDKSEVDVLFAATRFRPDQDLQFRSRLEPTELAWTQADHGQRRLPKLKPGDYELRAQASFDGESWGPTSTLLITRQAHFYQTPQVWLWSIGLSVLIGLVWLARRLYWSHLDRLHAEMIASELDQLGDGMRFEDWQENLRSSSESDSSEQSSD